MCKCIINRLHHSTLHKGVEADVTHGCRSSLANRWSCLYCLHLVSNKITKHAPQTSAEASSLIRQLRHIVSAIVKADMYSVQLHRTMIHVEQCAWYTGLWCVDCYILYIIIIIIIIIFFCKSVKCKLCKSWTGRNLCKLSHRKCCSFSSAVLGLRRRREVWTGDYTALLRPRCTKHNKPPISGQYTNYL